jgi:hypothetical protein
MSDYTFSWSEVYIVGNGPSAARLLPMVPAGANVLCLNDAVFHVGRLNRHNVAFFTLDKDWVRAHKDFLAVARIEKHVALPLETWPDCAGIPGVRYYGWSHMEGLSDDPDVIATGQNSGYGALGICWHKGTKVVHLIGYDMDDEYMRNYWAPFFAHALPQLEAKGVKVINHNRDSKVTAFPFADGFATGGYVTEGEHTCLL